MSTPPTLLMGYGTLYLYLHQLPWSTASSLFTCRVQQSFSTISFQVSLVYLDILLRLLLLSSHSIYHGPQHPPCLVSFSTISFQVSFVLLQLLCNPCIFHPVILVLPWNTSMPSQPISLHSTVIISSLFQVSQLDTWESNCYFNSTHPVNHSHLTPEPNDAAWSQTLKAVNNLPRVNTQLQESNLPSLRESNVRPWSQVQHQTCWCPSCHPTNSVNRKLKAPTPTSGLASSFLHSPPDSWGTGRCTASTNSHQHVQPLPWRCPRVSTRQSCDASCARWCRGLLHLRVLPLPRQRRHCRRGRIAQSLVLSCWASTEELGMIQRRRCRGSSTTVHRGRCRWGPEPGRCHCVLAALQTHYNEPTKQRQHCYHHVTLLYLLAIISYIPATTVQQLSKVSKGILYSKHIHPGSL